MKENVILSVLQVLAKGMGFELPRTIAESRMEIYNSLHIGLCSFLIYYAWLYEKGEVPALKKCISGWEELNGCFDTFTNMHCSRIVRNVFYGQVLANNPIPRKNFKLKNGCLLSRLEELAREVSKGRGNGRAMKIDELVALAVSMKQSTV